MHRISCFGDVDSAPSVTFTYTFRVKWGDDENAIAPCTFDIKYVLGAFGPRLETLKKGRTISGWPGGPVHGVDHLYLSGACVPDASSGFEDLYDFSSHLIAPICDSEFSEVGVGGNLPILNRGECMARLLSVSLEPGTTPGDTPYSISVRVEFHARTNWTLDDQEFSWISTIYLDCPMDGYGQYIIGSSITPLYGAVGSFEWVNAPLLPPPLSADSGDVWVVRAQAEQTGSNPGSSSNGVPPYLDSLLSYWQKEKHMLHSCKMDPDKVRDCTLDAMQETAFTTALTLENLKDMLELMKTFRSFLALYKDVRTALRKLDALRLLRVVATIHLIHRYVIKTTDRDVRDLLDFAKQIWAHRSAWWDYLATARGRSGLAYEETNHHGKTYENLMNLRLDLRPAQYQLYTYLRTVGVGPNLVDFWDLIPLSFVVDWVLPIGEMIEGSAALIDLQRIDKLFVTTLRSHRLVSDTICPGVLLLGKSQRFQRIVSSSYEGTQHVKGLWIKNPLRNFWTAVALLIASITRR